MLNIAARITKSNFADQIQSYFKQSLKQVCTLAPADSNVSANLEEWAEGFDVKIDVQSTVFTGCSQGHEQNAYLAIDAAIGAIQEKIRIYKDSRNFN